jgi:hypothetical protein
MVIFVLPQTQHLQPKEIKSISDVPVIAFVFFPDWLFCFATDLSAGQFICFK